MNFYTKVIGGFVVILALALAIIFLFRTTDEKAIEKLLEQGLEAATDGEEEKVIALISPNYRNGEETRDGIIRRIRGAVKQRIKPARIKGSAIQVSGDDAAASVTVEIGMLQYRQTFGLHLKLRKENGVWRVTSADETR
ncbi:MAG TPA: hypothetical protein VE981_13540 [Planctomycetota bacterium]|nr:hypothetical protein [Planctomycetota bacterium]